MVPILLSVRNDIITLNLGCSYLQQRDSGFFLVVLNHINLLPTDNLHLPLNSDCCVFPLQVYFITANKAKSLIWGIADQSVKPNFL